jgi:uncharacterized protein (TIGR04255 family)
MNLTENHATIRSEFETNGFVVISQISSNSSILIQTQTSSQEMKGLLVDIDVIKNGSFDDFWSNTEAYLEEAHNAEKNVFLGIVKQETMDQYD